jgi:hypothetical protein
MFLVSSFMSCSPVTVILGPDVDPKSPMVLQMWYRGSFGPSTQSNGSFFSASFSISVTVDFRNRFRHMTFLFQVADELVAEFSDPNNIDSQDPDNPNAVRNIAITLDQDLLLHLIRICYTLFANMF